MWYTKENMNDVCPHGSQRRKCIHCESIWQDKRIAELERQLEWHRNCGAIKHMEKRMIAAERESDELRAEVERLRDALKLIATCKSTFKGDVVDIAQQTLRNKQEGKPQFREDQLCANCGQYLGGGIQCCDNPMHPSVEKEKYRNQLKQALSVMRNGDEVMTREEAIRQVAADYHVNTGHVWDLLRDREILRSFDSLNVAEPTRGPGKSTSENTNHG